MAACSTNPFRCNTYLRTTDNFLTTVSTMCPLRSNWKSRMRSSHQKSSIGLLLPLEERLEWQRKWVMAMDTHRMGLVVPSEWERDTHRMGSVESSEWERALALAQATEERWVDLAM